MNVLENPRVVELLKEAEKAVQLMEKLPAGERGEIGNALEGIYRDLGRIVHGLMRQPTRSAAPRRPLIPEDTETQEVPEQPPGFTGEHEVRDLHDLDLTDGGGGSWYTMEVEVSEIKPMFSPEDGLNELNDLPLSQPPPDFGHVSDPTTDVVPFGPDDPTEVYAVDSQLDLPGVHPAQARPAWFASFEDLWNLLELPNVWSDPQEMAVEASRIQWASSGLQARWGTFPRPVQQTLLGLVAARARHLQEVLEVDVGPRVALDRLRSFSQASGLSWVAGLDPNGSPERNTWAEDAVTWWNKLDALVNPR